MSKNRNILVTRAMRNDVYRLRAKNNNAKIPTAQKYDRLNLTHAKSIISVLDSNEDNEVV